MEVEEVHRALQRLTSQVTDARQVIIATDFLSTTYYNLYVTYRSGEQHATDWHIDTTPAHEILSQSPRNHK